MLYRLMVKHTRKVHASFLRLWFARPGGWMLVLPEVSSEQ